jgi:hypothetical protein
LGLTLDFPEPEAARQLSALDALADRLGEVLAHLAAGVDPQRAACS